MQSSATPVKQPKEFAFTPENAEKAKRIIACYPKGRERSAVMPLLDLAQRQHDNWLPIAAMDHVADMLSVPRVKVYEVASFYTMYNRAPVGRHHVQVCTNISCCLSGSDGIVQACREKLGINPGETTKDGAFTLSEVECLGACVNAPMAQIDDDYYEDLSPESMGRVLDALANGQKPMPGSQIGRQGSAKKGATG